METFLCREFTLESKHNDYNKSKTRNIFLFESKIKIANSEIVFILSMFTTTEG